MRSIAFDLRLTTLFVAILASKKHPQLQIFMFIAFGGMGSCFSDCFSFTLTSPCFSFNHRVTFATSISLKLIVFCFIVVCDKPDDFVFCDGGRGIELGSCSVIAMPNSGVSLDI